MKMYVATLRHVASQETYIYGAFTSMVKAMDSIRGFEHKFGNRGEIIEESRDYEVVEIGFKHPLETSLDFQYVYHIEAVTVDSST